jgi:titin
MVAVLMATGTVGAFQIAIPQGASALGPTTVNQTFDYTGSTDTFTVPSGITAVTVTMTGGQGGQGGTDSSGPSETGGYRGLVTGRMTVTPGQVLTLAVGSGGQMGSGGAGSSDPANYDAGAAIGGSNPLGGYDGGNGGVAGYDGSSGFAGGAGAASVITTGGTTIVAGGSGGAGGSGQFAPTIGRAPYATFQARSDATTSSGQKGITAATVCIPGDRCDGGGGGAGGGGVQGGAQGSEQFGSGDSNEWYGYGGYPGQNTTGSVSGLTASYDYYPGNSGHGSITIGYSTGAPGAPTSVNGLAGNASAALSWTAPADTGESAITDYVVQYAPESSPTDWTTFSDAISTTTSATVTGLTNGVGYVFQIIPVNAVGEGTESASTGTVTPSGPPDAPTISGITAQDGGLSVAFTEGASGSTILDYEYQLNGTGPWSSSGSAVSPLAIAGLTNGTQYAVEIRAVSAIGSGDPSGSVDATPQARPGAPTITSISTSAASAAVSFVPGYSGGGVITDYEYQLNGGINGGPWTSAGSTTSPLAITGLDDGTEYTVAVRAMNSSGPGPESQTSSFTTPSVPAAPDVSISSGDESLAITYTPGDPGGSTITGYEYSLDGGSLWTTATTDSPIMVSGLTNGTTYSVSVRAVSSIGNGDGSTPQDATPATVPGAPSIVGDTVAGSDSQLSADFTVPGSDGGSPITGYEYSTDAGATWRSRDDGGSATSIPLVISNLSSDGTTALVNGTTYSVELRAVNAAGTGLASAVATGIAGLAPAPPTITAVTEGSRSLQVVFTPGANGGAQITGYEYQLNSGGWVTTGTLGNRFTIIGLDNGTSYAVRVRATNSVDTGTESAPVSGTPSTTPAQPTITSVLRGDRVLTVAVADANDGGLAITGWEYSTDGGSTWRSAGTATSPLTITTLSTDGTTLIANGTSYRITVRALNHAGSSVGSATTSVGPGAAPSAPTVTLTPQNHAIRVAFSEFGDGGSPISAVEYSLGGGTWHNAGTLSSPFTIPSLTNGSEYTVQVRAENAIGSGAESALASTTPLTVPDAPTSVAAVANDGSADLTWTAPGGNGGSAITSYTATAYTDSTGMTTEGTPCTSATTACSITGLTNGTVYDVSVVAVNPAGAGIASSPRVQVTPLAKPDAPTLTSLSPGNAFLTLGYNEGSPGTLPITGYQYQLNGEAWQTASSTTSPLTISGVSNGTSYTVALRAVSAAGLGATSGTLTATPFTYPDAPNPLSIVATGHHARIDVSWAAPASNGSEVTGYTATAFTDATGGLQASTCSTSGTLTCTLEGLTDGTPYYVSLQASNPAGLSQRSEPRVGAIPALDAGTVPTFSTPLQTADGYTFTIDNYSSSVSYDASPTGGSASVDTSGLVTVTGLEPGTAATTTVTATQDGFTTTSDSTTGSALDAGEVPTLSTPERTADGYTFTIDNYSSSVTYDVAATDGSASVDSSGVVTVTGLEAGTVATTTVTATRTGFTTTSDSTTGSALDAGAVPAFSTPVRTAEGYTFDITNYFSSVTYDAVATNGASASINVFGQLTVTGLIAGSASTTTVTASEDGFTTTSDSTTSSALDTGTVPTFSTPVRTAGGYTFTISNYSSSVSYDASPTNGSAFVDSSGLVTVTGLAAGSPSTTTVTASRTGYTTTARFTTGSSLSGGTTPTFSTPLRTTHGYTFAITNYSPGLTYEVAATNGATVVTNVFGQVTVTGLAAGAPSTTTVSSLRAGYTTKSTSTTQSALNAGTAPTFSTRVRTADGYMFTITNFSANVDYTLTATNHATATADLSGHVTVTGLPANTPSTTTVTATRAGFTTTSAWTTRSSLIADTTPWSDFTGDGVADLLAVSSNGTLYLAPGNGHGGLTGTRTRIGTGWNRFTKVSSPGDFTGDYKADVLAVSHNGNLYLYPGNGHGGLTGARTRIGTGWDGFTKVRSPGDFTGDHKADLLAFSRNGNLYLYPGNGHGGLTGTRTRIGTGWNRFTKVFSSGDVTGDHRADLLAISHNGNLYVYPGNGHGRLTGTRTRIGTGWDRFTKVFSPGDFTGDHKADLLAISHNGNLYLYPGNGHGGLTGTRTRIGTGWGTFPKLS